MTTVAAISQQIWDMKYRLKLLDGQHVDKSIGDTWARQGDAQAATEYYLTAVYLAPDSPAGRRALLSAARTLATAKDRDGAATLYRKLLAQTGLPADIADEARRGLSDLKP